MIWQPSPRWGHSDVILVRRRVKPETPRRSAEYSLRSVGARNGTSRRVERSSVDELEHNAAARPFGAGRDAAKGTSVERSVLELQRQAGNQAVTGLVRHYRAGSTGRRAAVAISVQRHAAPLKASPLKDEEQTKEEEEEEEGQPKAQRSLAGAPTVQRFTAPAWWTNWKKKRAAAAAQKKGNKVAPGDQLPDVRSAVTEKMKDAMKFDAEVVGPQVMKEMVPSALEIIDDDAALEAVYQATLPTLTQVKSVPADPGKLKARIKELLGAEIAKLGPQGNFDDAMNSVKSGVVLLPKEEGYEKRSVGPVLGRLNDAVIKRATAKGQLKATGRRPEIAYQGVQGFEDPTDAFLEERKNVELEHGAVKPEDQPGFAAALKTMPTVGILLAPDKGAGPGPKQARGATSWRDPGPLSDKMKLTNDLVGPKKWLGERRFKSKSLRKRIDQADSVIRTVVEPEVLGTVPRPTMNVHATAAQSLTVPWGFRAEAGDGHVEIAYDEDMPTIAHELGHAVEARMPLTAFHDVHLLLTERHKAAGGGETAAKSASVFTPDEGRYAGKWATGKYTSKAYKNDMSGEVFSMAMQYFSEPDKMLKIVEEDPQHAALILRIMRPDEYAKTHALRPYDKYLPQKMSEENIRRREAQRKTDLLFGIKW